MKLQSFIFDDKTAQHATWACLTYYSYIFYWMFVIVCVCMCGERPFQYWQIGLFTLYLLVKWITNTIMRIFRLNNVCRGMKNKCIWTGFARNSHIMKNIQINNRMRIYKKFDNKFYTSQNCSLCFCSCVFGFIHFFQLRKTFVVYYIHTFWLILFTEECRKIILLVFTLFYYT